MAGIGAAIPNIIDTMKTGKHYGLVHMVEEIMAAVSEQVPIVGKAIADSIRKQEEPMPENLGWTGGGVDAYNAAVAAFEKQFADYKNQPKVPIKAPRR